MANTVANNFGIFGQGAGEQAPNTACSGTVQLWPLGYVAKARDPNLGYGEFVYCVGAAASAPTAGDFVLLNAGWTAQQVASGNTASLGPCGVAMAALSATNVYGWVQVQGLNNFCNLGTQGVGTLATPVCIGSTAGRAQTTAGATGYVIGGAYIGGTANYSTTNSNSALVQLMYPFYNHEAR